MKEEIYTIPVHDGFQEPSECPFCAMVRSLEEKTIQYVLSPSYMEEDVRGMTNDLGFCQPHLQRLYKEGNALGLALMMHSHLKHQHQVIMDKTKGAHGPKKLFAKKGQDESDLEAYRRRFKKSCYVCDRVETVFDRYIDAFFMLYKRDKEFVETVFNSQGFCLDHFMRLYDRAGEALSAKDGEVFREKLLQLEDKELTRVEDELEWFTLKFDYRYADKPWKNSKDALPRSIQKINSQIPVK